MSSDLHTFYQDIPAEIVAKLQKIKLVVFDVDGTLTDSHIVLDDTSREYKFFDSKDGMGVSLLQKARYSYLTTRRAQELQIKYVIQGERDKEDALLNLLHELQVQPEELAVMGDDINDLPMFKHAAVSAAPADGYHYMRTIATIKLTRNGGRGAAREFADLILMAQGLVTPEGDAKFLRERNILLRPSSELPKSPSLGFRLPATCLGSALHRTGLAGQALPFC